MPNSDGELRNKAIQLWEAGQTLEAGRLICEDLSPEARVEWAANILRLVVERAGIECPSIDHVLSIAKHPLEWKTAHDANSVARNQASELCEIRVRSAEQNLLLSSLTLAFLVARVIYNATDPSDPFDEDNGWSIASSLKKIVEMLDDSEFSQSSLSALCGT